MINEHRLNLFIRDYTKGIQKTGEIWGYIGIVITCIASLFTSDFKALGPIPKEFIPGFFFAVMFIAGFFLIKTGYEYFQVEHKTPEDLIREIKKGESEKTHIKEGDFQ